MSEEYELIAASRRIDSLLIKLFDEQLSEVMDEITKGYTDEESSEKRRDLLQAMKDWRFIKESLSYYETLDVIANSYANVLYGREDTGTTKH